MTTNIGQMRRRTRSQTNVKGTDYKEKEEDDFSPDIIDSDSEDERLNKGDVDVPPIWLKDDINDEKDVDLDSDQDSDQESKKLDKLLEKNTLQNVSEKNDESDDENLEEEDKRTVALKLKKLNEFVKQSQVYSGIIADTLLQRTVERQEEIAAIEAAQMGKNKKKVITVEDSDEPPKKKQRKKRQNIMDFFKSSKTKSNDEDEDVKKETQQDDDEINSQEQAYAKGQPTLLKNCILKPYQFEGLNWLITLYENGLNGILADDMGLGKTIQSIALLSFIYEMDTKGPFLITAPLSTLDNWMNEFTKFAPDIPVLKYYSNLGVNGRLPLLKKFFQKTGNTGVIITSYDIILRDASLMLDKEWKFLIVDEGHRLKNVNGVLIRELKKINTSNRLLLTGTPLQNNLSELWSLLNFILPEIFSDFEIFNKWFNFSNIDLGDNNNNNNSSSNSKKLNKIINDELEKNLISNLHNILKPFLLRRLKKNVLANILPSKREYIINCPLTIKQKKFYLMTLDKKLKITIFKEYVKEFFTKNNHLIGNVRNKSIREFIDYKLNDEQRIDDEDEIIKDMEKLYNQYISNEIKNIKTQNLLMQLRQIVNSTYTQYFPFIESGDIQMEDLIKSSGKIQVLNQLVPDLIRQGHKVIIFSQFAKTLELLEDWADLQDYSYCIITGDMKNETRKEEIEKFNNLESKTDIFFLSTRAGGLGINLTAADSVILFDSDWNPQVDLQAMDRCYRIGQEKPVIVYRFICNNTIENLILTRAMNKRKLEKLVIQMGKFNSLKKMALNEKSFLNSNTNTTTNNKELLDELAMLLEMGQFSFNSSHQNSNETTGQVLSEKEMEEITDRSDASYLKRDVESPNVMLFETSSSFLVKKKKKRKNFF
ncbi:hypothetical protein TBLA_0D04710 [Henningerozyma blattae CBS 6284]|uniref:Uncharacterized protein n=1 Tax=Henningerozyma blattae (strain ATCC 34711 / CBS 6284 / DSM 70876 / NBRC 10599 / NRRL Y-10934 / UCD 77-7) TaxID=1071380 RepID=I2H3L5_HENB6|nr:hypothetical protein TBLA_0D04710 [Tetrapisispora blattae CBS 6284]CCH60967.1 hypothetical protein TBLA_0D04710 [Tetrapisispora blattae CBS 6284]